MKKFFFLMLVTNISYLSFCQDLTKQLKTIKEKHTAVGLTVNIINKGKLIYSFSDGLRDIERNLPLNENTSFRIASVSKMVTVTAIMQLYDQGLFKLNDDVSPFLGYELRNPAFPEIPVTFTMLMSHTSGLRDGTGYDNFLSASYRQKPYPLLSSVLMPGGEYYTEDMWSKTQSPVSGYFTYANINFGILGTLIERISGKRFDKYCIEHIFKPLQMTCSFDVRDLPDINQVAVIYRKENAKWIPQTDNWKGVRPPDRNLDDYVTGSNAVLFAPQGGLRISVDDLTRFMMLHQQKGILNGIRIISDTALVRMHEVVWKYNGSNGDTEKDFFTTYALGCMKTNRLIPEVEVLGHSGDAYGLLSGLYFSEKEDFGIVFITNGGEWKPGSYSGWQSIEEEVFKNCYEHIKKLR